MKVSRVKCNIRLLMESLKRDAESRTVEIPWWIRFTRWRQQSLKEGRASESQLLELNRQSLQQVDVPVGDGKQEFIHTVLGGTSNQPPLVMAPGYAAGLGFYWRNVDGLSPHFQLLAFDWLGTGLSGRPAFVAQGRQASEDFFVESLNNWRIKMGLDKFLLMGHSLGGYLSACYALKYPQHVSHLLLVCPAGVPEAPENWQSNIMQNATNTRKTLFKTFVWAWEKGVTPGSVIRTLGPLGPRLIDGYVSNRFRQHGQPLNDNEYNIFKRYFYQIIAAPGSGEYALRHLLAPGAWAHAPLEHRLHELTVPVTFIYGEEDWMQPKHAVKLCERLKEERSPKVESDLKVEIIPNAGHFVFLEQPQLFDRAVLDACASHLGEAEHQKASSGIPGAVEMSRSDDSSEWSFKADVDQASSEYAPAS
ncbi:hypothetical protein CEUSTIGMA_g2555.t1 [Chlamydomonas eustigma]|uniref:AB hydrolase-1 domain-containing protein n=1 Tax=Chlamydomonas eustigma TaxID=1157962 RepID=A0A250WWB7_9CHLO|nr:hypothetical protein CEUSTIGMA_g2555.t1 [Chlamydomonas eustigma]|eukprot:GAX75111.1 hypothetical protein CEUSTIGMA_g2555.t1 [Chlamydomonas eustigma]